MMSVGQVWAFRPCWEAQQINDFWLVFPIPFDP
jgi:hypothetical protein